LNNDFVKEPVTPAVSIRADQGSQVHSSEAGRSSYGQIFKSSAFIGGASVINILLGIVRNKVMAVLLGPSGVGLIGLYTTITGLASTLAGMGIGSSGVRQIAEAAGSGNQERIARTIKTLRRCAWVLGTAGALLLAAFSFPLSVLTFKDHAHAVAIAVLGITVFIAAISTAQSALLQGLRRIADLARLNILGALAGTIIGLPLIWWLRERGIVPLLVVLPAAGLVFSWWFARRVSVASMRLTYRETAREARGLLGLGLAFMAAGLMVAAVAYVTRLMIVRQLGLGAAGCYTAAYTLSGIYAGFILQAMGADFYPRLTDVAEDNSTVNRLVNEQAEIALLMAVSGILATLTLAPWVIRIFYASAFEAAAAVLQWQVLGVFGQVISWPIGFILFAKGAGKFVMITEGLACAIHLGLVWLLIPRFGVAGAGMAFAALYAFHTLFLLVVSRKLTGFRWSRLNLQLLGWMLPLVAGVFAATYYLPFAWSLPLGLGATLASAWVCLKGLLRRVPAHRLRQYGVLARWAHKMV
jgi:antigen flippase